MSDIWILGAAGRSGRAIAGNLARMQASLVLVGRSAASLEAVAESIGGSPRIVIAGSLEAIVEAVRAGRPGVVMNTIGPFARTALPVVGACAPGTHYLDLANELPALLALFGRHDAAVAAGQCLVPGAGYGVLGTEAVVLKLCEGRAAAARVRVDTAPFVDGAGLIGHTLAETIIEGLPEGGWRYRGGRLVRAGLGADYRQLTKPDGESIGTGAMPTGDLEAARRASGALDAVAASTMAPGSPLVRALMPAVIALSALRPLRALAIRRIAGIHVGPAASGPKPTWSHARVEWADGTVREGWLRAGDASDFTARVAAEVAIRLARDEGRPGTYTPGALFGPDLAVSAGAAFILS